MIALLYFILAVLVSPFKSKHGVDDSRDKTASDDALPPHFVIS
jgi:hypothetical protein